MWWLWIVILVALIVVISVAINRRGDTGGKPGETPYAGDIRRTSSDNSG